MIYRKLPKTASLPATGFVSAGISVSVLADAIPIVTNSRKIAPVAKDRIYFSYAKNYENTGAAATALPSFSYRPGNGVSQKR